MERISGIVYTSLYRRLSGSAHGPEVGGGGFGDGSGVLSVMARAAMSGGGRYGVSERRLRGNTVRRMAEVKVKMLYVR